MSYQKLFAAVFNSKTVASSAAVERPSSFAKLLVSGGREFVRTTGGVIDFDAAFSAVKGRRS